ncbi:carbonyl reductase [NADPH] 3 isoform X2 [Lepus europaeus]|uniref:carbonyl reductase [NADPH] 3 isoform X2 n=1 Tax=Lepus europaeus TaxID=9983 RepID=UPI002B4672D2|nr:carbonyl reductase [NADPH] 3 isoform X2 [Lepus europaeus]
MSSCSRVALVTGANKGVGFAITRDLCRLFSGDVVLTARDEARGRAAVQQLQAEGLSPRFHQLDITDLQSIRALRDFLRREYGGLNVLVNNAAIAFQTDDPTPFDVQAELTVKTNFFATRNVCTELLPIMKPHGMEPTWTTLGNQWSMFLKRSAVAAPRPAPTPQVASPALSCLNCSTTARPARPDRSCYCECLGVTVGLTSRGSWALARGAFTPWPNRSPLSTAALGHS